MIYISKLNLGKVVYFCFIFSLPSSLLNKFMLHYLENILNVKIFRNSNKNMSFKPLLSLKIPCNSILAFFGFGHTLEVIFFSFFYHKWMGFFIRFSAFYNSSNSKFTHEVMNFSFHFFVEGLSCATKSCLRVA